VHPAPAESAAKKSRRKRSGKSRRSRKSAEAARELAANCGSLLGQDVASIEYPGGRSRRSCRIILQDGTTAIASERSRQSRARTERLVLGELSAQGVAVPRLLASDGKKLLIQQEIPGQRLAQALHKADDRVLESLLDTALGSLATTQQAGSAAGLDTRLKKLGDSREWLAGLLERPAVIGRILDVPAPRFTALQLEDLLTLLAMRSPRFIKWDARPGNAMAHADGRVFWFDWEHCGVRNRLDDMAWLLGDEHVPEHAAVESRLIEKHLARYADDLSIAQARSYLSAYGVFHLAVRLGLIFKYKVKGDWWDHDYCVNHDKVGVTAECLKRVCARGARWALVNPSTEALAPWFSAVFARYGNSAENAATVLDGGTPA
jgi:hypothetical protein